MSALAAAAPSRAARPASLADVLRAGGGAVSAHSVAARAGVPLDLAEAMLDHAQRLGLAERFTTVSPSCGACPGEDARPLPVACAGCPLARR